MFHGFRFQDNNQNLLKRIHRSHSRSYLMYETGRENKRKHMTSNNEITSTYLIKEIKKKGESE